MLKSRVKRQYTNEYDELESGGGANKRFNNNSKNTTFLAQRSGKWTSEEESFANQLVLEFEGGTLQDCEEVC